MLKEGGFSEAQRLRVGHGGGARAGEAETAGHTPFPGRKEREGEGEGGEIHAQLPFLFCEIFQSPLEFSVSFPSSKLHLFFFKQ